MTSVEKTNTFHSYPRDKSIHSFFETMAENDPNRIAVEFDNERITYKDLNKSADRMATILTKATISVGNVVAISAERSIDMMIAIIGILKVGAAYLPVDTNLSEERKRYYLETSNAKMILSESDSEVLFDRPNMNIHRIPKWTLPLHKIAVPADAVAYIMFTSGSTGKPKGVMIKHHSVVNRLLWMKEHYGLNEKDIFLQKTRYSFDVSVWELFLWFFCGAKLCLLKSGQEGNVECLLNVIQNHGVTVCHFVPSMLSAFLDFIAHRGEGNRVACLMKVFSSGEALRYDVVTAFRDLLTKTNATQLHNLYGPTEATVDVTYFDCTDYESDDRVVPIGKPIWNTNLYILDENGFKCVHGEKGELYISGDGVALGYINNLELTKKAFIPDPFRKNATMYKTGDLARWNKGNIEFLGRVDNQVKIHGIRVELEEIENHINNVEAVSQSIVIAAGDYEKKLIAYYTGKSRINPSVFVSYLSEKLPKSMIPVEYSFMAEGFPLNQNGKIDRAELEHLYKERIVTTNESSETLGVIQQVIGREIELADDFLQSDIDSITFIRLVVALEAKYNFEFDDEKLLITEFPTVKSIVDYVESKK